MAPERLSHLQPQAPQALEPGAFGQRPEQAGGPVRVPAPHPTELRGRLTAKESRKHPPDHFAKKLLLTAQASFDLGHYGGRQPKILQSLVEGLSRPLGLALVALKALMSFQAAALSGFGVLFGISF